MQHTHFPSHQRGVVLFIALVALVVMSLAALALVRSVDTNGLIAGNIAFKQSATSAGDYGLDNIVAFITAQDTPTVSTDPLHYLNNSHPADSSGYYAIVDTNNAPTSATMFNISDENSWANAAKVGAVNSGDLAAAGMTVNYVIERMCRTDNQVPIPATGVANCLLASAQNNTGSAGGYQAGGPPPSTAGGAPIYRVTARIAGPQNTVSYVQAFIN
jgi:Tfp pilus assembly protein PilX